jgi:hypothetical protein
VTLQLGFWLLCSFGIAATVQGQQGVDCHIPGAQKSTDPPCGAHLAGLHRPRVVHRPPHVILLTLCSDHLAGRGDYLPLHYVHLGRRGGPHRHRAD